jgi:adenine deaminase
MIAIHVPRGDIKHDDDSRGDVHAMVVRAAIYNLPTLRAVVCCTMQAASYYGVSQ